MRYKWYYDKNWFRGPLWGWAIKDNTKEYGSIVEFYYGPFTKYKKSQ